MTTPDDVLKLYRKQRDDNVISCITEMNRLLTEDVFRFEDRGHVKQVIGKSFIDEVAAHFSGLGWKVEVKEEIIKDYTSPSDKLCDKYKVWVLYIYYPEK